MQPQEIGQKPPTVWKLDSENKPKNEAKFLKAIKFLQDNPEWVKDHQDEARKSFELLARTGHLSEEAKSIQKTLVEKFPNFFPTILVKIGGVERQILKDRLEAHSEKFKVMHASKFKESLSNSIELTLPEGIDNEEVLNAFLTYLNSGNIEITGENALDLMRLAQENNFLAFSFDCAKFIKKNLDISTFKEVLHAACHYQLTDLKWRCIVFASKNPFTLQPLTEKEEEISDAEMDVLKFGIECVQFGIRFSVSNEGKRSIRLISRKSFSEEGLNFLKKLHKEYKIEDLIISAVHTDDKDLNNLAEIIRDPFSIEINTCHITTIPERWLQSLELIDCDNISELISLHAQIAKEIHVENCSKLTSIIAKNAEWVTGLRCDNLTSIDAPNVKKIESSQSHKMRSLDTSNAKTIYCDHTGMTILDARKAKKINCSICPIVTLNAPEVENIDCHGCYITHLDVQKAKYINCSRCPISNLYAENAENIDCSECYDLIEINAQKSKKINSWNCENLITIYAPEVQSIQVRRCPNLKSLTVSKDCVIEGLFAKDCKITYVDSTITQKTNFKKLIEEVIEKHKDRHQVLRIELTKTIATFFLNPDIRIPLNELLEIAKESMIANEITLPENFNVRVVDESIELLLNVNINLSLVKKFSGNNLKKVLVKMQERLITTESSEQRAAMARVLLKANMLKATEENAKALHDAAVTYLRELIAPDSEAFASHERFNEALDIAAKLIRMSPLTQDERDELIQVLIEAISTRRPDIFLETEKDFVLDRRFKEVGQELWNVLGLGEFKITFDEAANDEDIA